MRSFLLSICIHFLIACFFALSFYRHTPLDKQTSFVVSIVEDQDITATQQKEKQPKKKGTPKPMPAYVPRPSIDSAHLQKKNEGHDDHIPRPSFDKIAAIKEKSACDQHKRREVFDAALKNLQQVQQYGKGTGGNQEGQPPLTDSDLKAVKEQIAKCWNIPSSVQGLRDLVVEIQLNLSSEGYVLDAQILQDHFSSQDDAYRITAESALRALLSPQCQPLKLPLDKYSHWKEITLHFSPKEFLE